MIELSVVVPACNERGAILSLLAEIRAAFPAAAPIEIIIVDDGSTDDTLALLRAAQRREPRLRILQHARRSGQSAALRSGVRAARAPWIATLDGDGQNDPADLPRLLARRDHDDGAVALYVGWRQERHDDWSKRAASRLANALRRAVLHDAAPDSGSGIKLFSRRAFLELPWFDHMHRYLPALMQRAGHQVRSVPVEHRARASGRSKYGNLRRGLEGVTDLVGVAWLMRRGAQVDVMELTPGGPPADQAP